MGRLTDVVAVTGSAAVITGVMFVTGVGITTQTTQKTIELGTDASDEGNTYSLVFSKALDSKVRLETGGLDREGMLLDANTGTVFPAHLTAIDDIGGKWVMAASLVYGCTTKAYLIGLRDTGRPNPNVPGQTIQEWDVIEQADAANFPVAQQAVQPEYFGKPNVGDLCLGIGLNR